MRNGYSWHNARLLKATEGINGAFDGSGNQDSDNHLKNPAIWAPINKAMKIQMGLSP